MRHSAWTLDISCVRLPRAGELGSTDRESGHLRFALEIHIDIVLCALRCASGLVCFNIIRQLFLCVRAYQVT